MFDSTVKKLKKFTATVGRCEPCGVGLAAALLSVIINWLMIADMIVAAPSSRTAAQRAGVTSDARAGVVVAMIAGEVTTIL